MFKRTAITFIVIAILVSTQLTSVFGYDKARATESIPACYKEFIQPTGDYPFLVYEGSNSLISIFTKNGFVWKIKYADGKSTYDGAQHTFIKKEKAADGSIPKFYYISDSSNVFRLCTSDGETIRPEELAEHFNTAVTPVESTVIHKAPDNPNIAEKDWDIWNDETYDLSDWESEIVELINAERAKAGAEPVTINTELSKIAKIKATEMADLNYASHKSPVYGDNRELVKMFDLNYKWVQENIYVGDLPSPASAVNAWLNSEGHRKAMLNPKQKEIGSGFVFAHDVNPSAKYYSYWSVIFAY